MKRFLIAISLIAGLSFAVAAPASAATRNYDCTKAGNANKAACKGAATSSAAKGKPAAPAVKTTSTTATKTTTTTRQYDCTKAGNANKTACKTAAAEAGRKTGGAVKTTTKSSSTTVDCTKFYNKMRAQCRTSTASAPARTTIAPAPKPTSALAKSSAANDNSNPVGATAQCKDGTYSHSKTHQGACSHHGGVAKWM